MMASDEFPRPRNAAVMFTFQSKLMIWGGSTQVIVGEGDDRFLVDIILPDVDVEGPVLEILDLYTYQWSRQKTYGKDIPDMGKSSYYAVEGNFLYLFGGNNDEGFCNGFYKLHLEQFHWCKLPSPTASVALGGTALYSDMLLFFGGVGNKFNVKYEADFKMSESFGYTFPYGWHNALFGYKIENEEWNQLNCSGKRPPPSSRFTFNKIDPVRALLFGGKQDKYTVTYNHIFILDMESLKWTGPLSPENGCDENWPCPRGLHASTCLVDPESDAARMEQRLITFWGQGKDAKHVHDIWIFHVQSCTWKKMISPPALKPRMFHMSCSYHIHAKQTDAIVYGGNKRRESKYDRNVTDILAIFRFGSIQRLDSMCLEIIRRNQMPINKLPVRLQNRVNLSSQNNKILLFYPYNDYFLQEYY